ncbi:T9SS type A sorting domain-containing protein [Chryseobacterium sp. Bi04]|uniref:T9SS type A sorting domain-containing protein n=1 Tax=Chryseobacterium sp. Bi04 TaxID=2822345 RepID=UPI001D574A57|nr:T9SS type A sorting domain-containing protein [Chryseobacterium sp. Bi04]CAH0149823.1 hypothetical protein SRABI04_00752 [Chryseobacterium sp. Bi04]
MKTHLFSAHHLVKAWSLISMLSLMTTFSFAQKVYVSNQNSQIYGGCLLCSLQNPQNAVGSNENDYSLMQIPLGIAARIEQTLIFPATTKLNKVVIGIGTGQTSLSAQLLGGVAIETFNGNVSNNDYKIVNSELLKINISNPSKGTIEFIATKPYDRVRVTLNSGLLNLNSGLSIYYAYHIPDGCTFPAFDPVQYYSFNGNINDMIAGFNMASTATPLFKNNTICGKGLGASAGSPYSLKAGFNLNGKALSEVILNHTIAFWAKTEPRQAGSSSPALMVDTTPERVRIAPDSIKLMLRPPNFGLTDNLSDNWGITPATEWNHYIIINNDGILRIYKNGELLFVDNRYVVLDLNNYQTILNLITEATNTIILDRSEIDEFVVYDKVLTTDEIKILFNSYKGISSNLSNISSGASVIKAIPEKEALSVTPNPTTGQITLDGSILLVDSDISVRNISGKEVYQSKFISKTFNLPVTLPGGVYILSLQTKDKKVYTRKIILTR